MIPAELIPDVKGGWTEGGVTIFITILLGVLVLAVVLTVLAKKWILPGINGLIDRIVGLAGDVQAVKHQVVNDHSTNLRAEQDERHNALVDQLNTLTRGIEGIREDVRAQGQRFLSAPEIDDRIRRWHDNHKETP